MNKIAKGIIAAMAGLIGYIGGALHSPMTSPHIAIGDTLAFEKYAHTVLGWEGTLKDWEGKKANLNDRGGRTNFGITQTTFNALSRTVLEEEPTDSAFVHLTPKKASLFLEYHWHLVGGDYFLSPGVALICTDMAWGSGLSSCCRRLRKVLREKFGYRGLATGYFKMDVLEFANKQNQSELVRLLVQERRDAVEWDCEQNPKQKVFKRGWLRRINELEAFVIGKDLVKKEAKKDSLFYEYQYFVKDDTIPFLIAPTSKLPIM
jgi:lysozyme family protein